MSDYKAPRYNNYLAADSPAFISDKFVHVRACPALVPADMGCKNKVGYINLREFEAKLRLTRG